MINSQRLCGFLAAGFCLVSSAVPVLWAQDTPAPETPATEVESDIEKTLSTMQALKQAIAETEAEIELKRALLDSVTTTAEQGPIGEEIQVLNEKITKLRADFDGVATGIDLKAYMANPSGEVDLSAEMTDFLQPIVTQLKDMTARPREIEELKNDIAYNTKRQQLASQALDHISSLLPATDDRATVADLESLKKTWIQRFEQAENNRTIAEFQLESKRADEGSVIKTISEAVDAFFRTRGRNLLLAALGFLTVFSGLRLIQRFIHRLSPMRKRGQRSIVVRIIDISYYVFTIIASTGVVLLVFYLTDDWLMLGLALLFLAGIAWTGKHTLPIFYEQAKLMLNLGSVREGERILYNGIPWKIKAINLFTELTNPTLQGGHLRLPLKELVPLLSRPFEPKEPWFPCEAGDWVVLSDGTFGKVITQTPEWVQVIKLGGSRKTYTTTDFVALNPENLSGNFRVRIVFGIDYQHQAICTTEVPAILQKKLTAELEAFVGAENLHNLAVEFREAGASSLDYEILADFTGSIASKFNKIQRAIPRICVEECNAHGWVIPFTQITLHQAPPSVTADLNPQ